jgi:hypothetical protein
VGAQHEGPSVKLVEIEKLGRVCQSLIYFAKFA